MAQLAGKARLGLLAFIILCAAMMSHAFAAPYAALVMDARTGQVLDSENADTRLHPASLTKMMTLYIAFQAIERGEVSLNSQVTVSANAAAQPPSRLGLRAGQRIELQYLIRAAAIKSANDAATAIGVGISGSEEAFAARMNATARAMGMNNTHFISMNGLTTNGHYSTARDMTILGRHLIYDFPQYYNLFSRRSADAGIATVRTTNSRLLDNYQGADGIKTGYTQAAGYNLTASAERGNVRIIATVFGATSNADRHTRITRLMDRGFANAPRNARLRPPEAPPAFLTPQQQHSPPPLRACLKHRPRARRKRTST
ncbi:Probable penicillin-binding protein [Ketogulonicigenium vulgare Y25]|nr:Probable penicillin-binding protein [Ketogulonicigenium vulgare Y25]